MGTFLDVLKRQDSGRILRLKATLNVIGVCYYICMITAGTILEWIVVLPELSRRLGFSIIHHRLFLLYLVVNVMGNYLLAAYRDVHLKKSIRKTSNNKNQKMEIPFRAHHCKLCNQCILKRDHHCFLIGKCIGYHNQKHFIHLCMYTALASLYTLITMAIYMHLIFKTEFSGALTFFTLLPTSILAWIQGSLGAYELLLGVFLYVCLMGCLIGCGFFFWQIIITALGLTTHEVMKGSDGMDRSIWENFSEVLGKYWVLGIFVPLPLPQHGTGTYEGVVSQPAKNHKS